jgi:hypothetical protein
VLDQLGLLQDQFVWSLMAQGAVDPLFLIRSIRHNKSKFSLVDEEHLVGDDVVFLAGDRNSVGYKVAYHVNVFTNDTAVLARDQDKYVQVKFESAEEIATTLAQQPATNRMVALTAIVNGHINVGLGYR